MSLWLTITTDIMAQFLVLTAHNAVLYSSRFMKRMKIQKWVLIYRLAACACYYRPSTYENRTSSFEISTQSIHVQRRAQTILAMDPQLSNFPLEKALFFHLDVGFLARLFAA
jgi:hypothetical protein